MTLSDSLIENFFSFFDYRLRVGGGLGTKISVDAPGGTKSPHTPDSCSDR